MLEPSEFQPRMHIDDAALDELARSIRANGVIQPIVVRRVGDRPLSDHRGRAALARRAARRPPEGAGGREGHVGDQPRAAARVGAGREPAARRPEPIEEATAYQRLAQEFSLTHDEIATRVGKDRSSVANTIRLLKLPPEVRADVSSNALSMGHARALVALPSDADQRRIAREVIARGLSVRETEALVKKAPRHRHRHARRGAKEKDADTRAAEEALHRAVGAPVEIVRRGKGGSVVIAFSSETELQRIYDYLTDGATVVTTSREGSPVPLRLNRLRAFTTPCLALLALTAALTAAQDRPRGTAAGEWPTYGGDLASTKYSPLDRDRRPTTSPDCAWRGGRRRPTRMLSVTMPGGGEWSGRRRGCLRRAQPRRSRSLARRRAAVSSPTSKPRR